jgi:serine/threonine-protein kinase
LQQIFSDVGNNYREVRDMVSSGMRDANLEIASDLMEHHSKQPFQRPNIGDHIASWETGNSYRIGDMIGEGGFGYVYACEDIWRNDLVAKVLKPHLTIELVGENVAREVLALLTVRHPNIVHVYDNFCFNGAWYIISERCSQTLEAAFSKPPFDGDVWFMPIARCLLQAVHHSHVMGLVHCDIHPGNIFFHFTRDEILPEEHSSVTFKLGDFGLAKSVGSVDPYGTFLESIRPPEALDPVEFGACDNRVDIYQAGLVLLQVALGKIIRLSEEDIISGVPRELAMSLPTSYSSALEKMLRRHVEHRTFTPLEAWIELLAN